MSASTAANAPHFADTARRLRSGAWLLKRSWRQPQRLPAGWRSERFARAVDRTRRQLEPIRTLTALSESFGRESRHSSGLRPRRFGDSPLEVAYATRWIELDAGTELLGWHILCQRASH